VYLGSKISEDGKCDQDIKRRSSLASAIVGKLGRIWRSYNISTKTKIKVYESECWNLRKQEGSNILSTEMGWLRKILGVSRLQKVRNETVRNILEQDETIIDKIQKRRLTWFGHVERMEDN